ncbi:hypothetical protein K9L97_01825 [Candidatus Woesearchaeota archaeon]|nr:hypothetical protein [Candidatus Woesearchaeota archaeon]
MNLKQTNILLEYIFLIITILGATGFIINYTPSNIFLLVVFITYKIIKHYNHKKNIGLKEHHYTIILFSLYAALLGDNLLDLFYIYPFYDKILHFILPFTFTYILLDINILKKYKFLAILIILGSACILEFIEFFVDQVLNGLMQGVFVKNQQGYLQSPHFDTMYDLLTGFFASILSYVIYILTKKDQA